MTTKLQLAMIEKIARCLLTEVNGRYPSTKDQTITWADVVIEDNEDKGVFTSLNKAGLAFHDGKGRDAVVGLTEEGYKVFVENFKNEE